jgi:hypothetical protein
LRRRRNQGQCKPSAECRHAQHEQSMPFQPTMLELWEHNVITILNLLDFHIVYCLVNRSVSFTRIVLPPLPTIHIWLVGGLREPLLMQLRGKVTKFPRKLYQKTEKTPVLCARLKVF